MVSPRPFAAPGAFRRAAAVLALAAALLDLGIIGLMHLLQPEVDILTAPTSSYALGTGGPAAQVGTLAAGVAALALAVAVSDRRSRRRDVVGLVLMAVFGAAKVCQAFFPIDPEGVVSAAGVVHNITGNVAFFVLPVAAVLVGGLVSRVTGQRPPAALAWGLVALTVGVLVGDAIGVFGLMQRTYLVLAACWMALCALAVLRSSRD